MNNISANNRLESIANNLQTSARFSNNNFSERKTLSTVQVASRALENAFLFTKWNPDRDKAIIEKMKAALNEIKRNQKQFSELEDFKLLEEEIRMLMNEGLIKKIFQAEDISTLSEKLKSLFLSVLNFLTQYLGRMIQNEIYHGWSKKIKDDRIKKLVEEDYKARYTNWYNKTINQATSTQQKTEADAVYHSEMTQIQEQLAKDAKLQSILEIEKKGEETRQLFMDMGGERIQLRTSDKVNLDATYLSANEFKHALKRQNGVAIKYMFSNGLELSGISIEPDDLNQNQGLIEKMKKLGLLSDKDKPGSGYSIVVDHKTNRYIIAHQEDLLKISSSKTPSGNAISFNPLSGYYELKANNVLGSQTNQINVAEDFRDTIQASGGSFYEIGIKGRKDSIPAFKIPFGRPVPFPEKFICLYPLSYYIQKEKGEELVRDGLLQFEPATKLWSWKDHKNVKYRTKLPIEWSMQQNSVAILSSGNAGVYEMHKGEVLTLLMNGCDVMMLNLRGYGGSEGEPTIEGNYKDIEAAYQYVKQNRKGIPDSKIVAWSMCLSGGIAAHLAEKHPYINLFLNQTYAEFWGILKPKIEKNLEDKLKSHIQNKSNQSKVRDILKMCLLPIVTAAVKMMAPNYNVMSRLPNIKGQICVMSATNDKLMTAEETNKMKDAIKNKNVQCDFVEIPGGHCTPWNQVVSYIDHQGNKFSLEDFGVISFNGYTYYINLKEAQKPEGFTIFLTDGNNFVVKKDINNPKSPLLLHANRQVWQINSLPITENQLPNLVGQLGLKPDFLGHHHIKKFLSDAQLANPLI